MRKKYEKKRKAMLEDFRQKEVEKRDEIIEPGIEKSQILTTNKLNVPQERKSKEPIFSGGKITTSELPGEGGQIKLNDRDYCQKFATLDDFKILREIIEKRPGPPAFSYWICPRCGTQAKLPGRFAGRKDMNCFSCNPRNLEGFPFMKELTKTKDVEGFEKKEKEKFERQITRMKEGAEMAKRTFEHEIAVGKFK